MHKCLTNYCIHCSESHKLSTFLRSKSRLTFWIKTYFSCSAMPHITTSHQFKVCISEMGITAGFCNLKAQFIPSDIAFKSVRFDSVKMRWDFMVEDSEANSRKWNNGLIKLSWAAKVWTYPFVLNVSMKLQRIIAHILLEVYGFKSFTKLLRLGYVFLKWRVLRASRKDLNEKFRPL